MIVILLIHEDSFGEIGSTLKTTNYSTTGITMISYLVPTCQLRINVWNPFVAFGVCTKRNIFGSGNSHCNCCWISPTQSHQKAGLASLKVTFQQGSRIIQNYHKIP